ncbi:conserved exported hypothetical protein [Paraburkholderia unamae]|uniref:carboxypeptidase-like regulatory domain-containing protein n=1 Tax=Paraburkholderia unamae TaxID=219649 RepID=UPI001CB2F269|nr:carboxypeptidase-like regulatory domain-containing protein [Paraburkholderia unamae]CAG9272472.1 conserved exported hypothetical protein [Paraburkholderia unamae]
MSRTTRFYRSVTAASLFVLAASMHVASAQTTAGLPAVQGQNHVEYVTGGIGHDQALALRDAGHTWPLSLGFFGPQGDYLANVHVEITAANAQKLLQAESTGPYMLVKLQPGAYHVTARYEGNTQQKDITIPQGKNEAVSFRF